MKDDGFRLQVLTICKGNRVVDVWVSLICVDATRPVSKEEEEAPLREKYLRENCNLSTYTLDWLQKEPRARSVEEKIKSRIPNWMAERIKGLLGDSIWRPSPVAPPTPSIC